MARVNFTAGRIAQFTCPKGTPQAFLWDAKVSGLALRVTKRGARAFVFQGRLKGQTIRMTIGNPSDWRITNAQSEARRLQGLIDQGKDPRIDKAATMAKEAAMRNALTVTRRSRELTGAHAWAAYCAERHPQWSARTRADHQAYGNPGGIKRKRAKGLTEPGPLHPLLAQPLAAIGEDVVCAWVVREMRTRPARARLGFRLLRAFINWCAEHREYCTIVQADACKSKRTREKLGKSNAKDDALQREQLPAWFAEVRKDPNPVVSAYLQTLLLTGARREELMGLHWEDIDFKWKSLRIRDKVEGERTIPLTPYVCHLLRALKVRNDTPSTRPRTLRTTHAVSDKTRWRPSPWVFSSSLSKSGRLQEPRPNHTRALTAAGLPHVTLHGLRRSFGTLAEWVEVPVGVVAQIQGHKPSAIAEKHYRVRPLDLLRMWHERIEAWMLNQAGVPLAQLEEAQNGLRIVSAA